MLYQKQTCRQKKHEKQPVLENHPDPVQTPFTQAAGNDDLYTDGESPG